VLAQAFQALGHLQSLVGVRADGEDGNQRRVVLGNKLGEKVQKENSFFASFRMEQFFGLIDSENQGWRLGRLCAVARVNSRLRLDQVLKE